MTAELGARGFVILPMPRIRLGPLGSFRGPESPSPELPMPKPVRSLVAEDLAVVRSVETPESDADSENPLVARLMERAVVELDKDGLRYPTFRDHPRTRVWRCGCCTTGVIAPPPAEFLPRVGQMCMVCPAKNASNDAASNAGTTVPRARRCVSPTHASAIQPSVVAYRR